MEKKGEGNLLCSLTASRVGGGEEKDKKKEEFSCASFGGGVKELRIQLRRFKGAETHKKRKKVR